MYSSTLKRRVFKGQSEISRMEFPLRAFEFLAWLHKKKTSILSNVRVIKLRNKRHFYAKTTDIMWRI
jgi:hypothetical protein